MSGMLSANHFAMGLRSKVCNERRRNLRIQSGSPFHHEICSTTPSFRPFSGANAYSTLSLQPSWYLLRSRSNVLIGGSVLWWIAWRFGGELPLPP